MTNKTIYLLVPIKGMSFKTGLAGDRVRMHLGRGKSLIEAQVAFERELNGGKTWNECLAACASPEDFENHKQNGWQVHADTENAWRSFKGSDEWPVMAEIEALLD